MDYTDQQKRMFYTSGYFNRWKLNFQEINLTVDNETIHTESPVVKESICEKEDLALGGCIASSFSFEVSEILEYELAGLEFTAQLETVSEDGAMSLVTPMGKYRVDSSETLDNKDYKQVIAYDALYDASEDVSKWYQAYFADDQKHTVKETRVSLLGYFGIPLEDQTLTNDDVLLEKTIDPNGSLTGTTALKALCEINGGFGRMNRQGRFEVIHLQGLGVFPEDQEREEQNLYPEDAPGKEILYPEDRFEYLGVSDYVNDYPEWRSITAEDYMTLPISCLNIRDAEDGIGVTVGDDLSNPYVITGNLFLYGKSPEELSRIGANILSRIKGITYRPNTTELNGLPYMEPGDVYAILRNSDPVESYILSRTLKGIGVLIDTYETKGNEVRANEVTTNEEIMQLKGKTLILKKSVDGVSSELTDFEKQTSSKFEQTDEAIKAEVKRATESEGELSGRIDITAGQVVLKADANGRIVAVELTADPKDGTEFKVEADNISLSAEEAMEFLAGGTLNLTGQKIKIESDNFSVDEDGNATVNSIDILGGSINIGDKFVVDENGICSQLEGNFTINVKNIEITAEEAVDLMAGGTLNLSGKDINIESDNFNVDASGKVEAKSLYVTGGSIHIETCAEGENIILLKNGSYEGAYDGPIRFFVPAPPKSPSKLGAKKGDFYYDTANKVFYKCTGIAGMETLFWTDMFSDEIDKPEQNNGIRFYGSGAPKESPSDMDARLYDEYLDVETGDVYRIYPGDEWKDYSHWKLDPLLKKKKENISWKELRIGTENSIEITEYKWDYYDGEYYKVSNGVSIQSAGIEFNKSGYSVRMGHVMPFEISGSIKLDEGEPDEAGNINPSLVFSVPVKAPNIS